MSTLNILARKKTGIAMLKIQAKPKKIQTNKQTNKQIRKTKKMKQQQQQKKKKKRKEKRETRKYIKQLQAVQQQISLGKLETALY